MLQKIRTAAGRWPLALSLAVCGIMLAGCEDHVTVTRDNLIPVPNGATWAWKPAQPRKERADSKTALPLDPSGHSLDAPLDLDGISPGDPRRAGEIESRTDAPTS
jgi:hypothetical protein